MVIDRVTSLADLAFKGRTNKYYRQLAIITASYYGKPDLTWKEAMLFLNKVSAENNPSSCAEVVRDVNYNRESISEDFVERPEQLELSSQPKKKIITYDEWVDTKKMKEWDSWYGYGYINERDRFYTNNDS